MWPWGKVTSAPAAAWRKAPNTSARRGGTMNPLEGCWGTETFLEGLVALGIAFMIVLVVFVTKFWWAILLVLTLGSVAAVIGANIHRRKKKAHSQTVCH